MHMFCPKQKVFTSECNIQESESMLHFLETEVAHGRQQPGDHDHLPHANQDSKHNQPFSPSSQETRDELFF
jgi:hypothetical protein